ncbi:DUF3800 domain-containing protein [Cytobacillus firmus]|uniref:DUF3800 domain-containing protein n=1 Tax=Cytobacillus firmus TaxID=1399 RepID=UPI0024C0EF73|nr:DUF3800 domain-containing protein [Cytobacillus firmus]WHY63248.1 DUF3800 domain-containing protein [Cytobacillus firmus]
MTNYNLYCDESGNSGGNFLDEQQPFYVLVGWIVERNLSYRAKNRVTFFKSEHYPNKDELKGVEILKGNIGQHNANNLFKELGEYCSPFFIIAEKKYCLAAKIVETYLDPIHNDFVPTSHTWMNKERKKIADLLYNFCNEGIRDFGSTYKNPSLDNLSKSLKMIINDLSINGFSELADIFAGAYDYMEDIYKEEFSMIDHMPQKAMRSLNLPVFTAFIQLIEKFTSNIGIKNVKMFHDNTKQFEMAYPEAFGWYSRKKKEDIEFVLENGQVILSSLKSLRSITFSDSKDSPLIQAADLLASFINMYATKTIHEKKLSPELIKFGKFLMGGLLASDQSGGEGFCDLISSQYFKEKLLFNNGLISEFSKNDFREFPGLSIYKN